MTLNKFVLYFGSLLLLVNFILYSRSYRLNSKAFRVFCLYLLYTLILQISTHISVKYLKSNLFLSHYYFIGQFLLLSFFYRSLTKNVFFKNLVIVVLLIILAIIASLFFNNVGMYNSFSVIEITLCSVPLIVYSVMYFFESMTKKNKLFIYINSGVFIYLLSSTLIFSSGNLMPDLDPSINKVIWSLNSYLYLIYQILIFTDWYKHFSKKEITSLRS
jgi:hypothetical protein